MKKCVISILILISVINISLYSQQLHRAGLLLENISKCPLIKKAELPKVLHKLASVVDNSVHLPPVGDQGQQGSCVAWAFGYYYKTYQEWQDYGWSLTDPNHVFSPAFIYNNIDGGVDGGSFFSDALKLLTDNGCATIAELPYNASDYYSFPSGSVYRDAIKYRSDSAFYIQTNDMTGINQVKQFLANGNIAVLGIAIYGNFDNINKYNNTYCVKDTTGNFRGSHALTIVGYDDNRVTDDGTGAFRMVNQWGTAWGDNGYCWMSYQAVMDSTLSGRYVFYTTDKLHYSPTIIASIQITHPNINVLGLSIGIGAGNSPIYSKSYFNFIANVWWKPARPFPNNNIDVDLSDGLRYLDTTKSNNVFLGTQSTDSGTVNNFSVTDLRVPVTTTSTEIPKPIPNNNTTVFTNDSVKIVHSNTIYANVSMMQDWNLVSVPVIAPDMSASALFSSANSPVYGYSDKYNIITTLENGKGYWVRYSALDTLKISGQSVNSSTIPVTAGWNLVGGYEKNVNINQITTTPWGIINSPFYGYSSKYEIPTKMEVGKSYWVRTSDSGFINIGNALAKSVNQTLVQGKIDPKWIKVIIRDSKGNQSTVYAVSEAINFDSYALPPLPPSGVFDVRWDSDQLVDNINNGTKNLLIQSSNYPITLSIEGGNLKIEDNAGGQIINTIVTDGKSIEINNPGLQSFQLSTVEIPTAFNLSQNYPNPFNPSTIIKYAIPYSSNVKLEIYNILGEKIKDLVNEQKNPGNYDLKFNTTGLASGVYFYVIEAKSIDGKSEFRDAKKMVLLK
ncbi:MAG: C1 family peptidase [Ignavibacteriaceae bacterium]